MSTTTERVRELVEPLVADLGATVYDVEHAGGVLRILLQRAEGLDMSVITSATRAISAALDAADPLPGSYTLEVSSPGLDRPLRTIEHYRGAIGEQVKLKLSAGVEGDRRVEGELVAASDGEVTVRAEQGDRVVAVADVERARTHLEWTPPPKPGAPGSASSKKKQSPQRSASDEDATGSPPQTGSSTPQSEATS
jgi:ribosome maturation factor RimP